MPSEQQYKYVQDSDSSYKRGLDYQREAFKSAKHSNDTDSMADALENLKSEIKAKMIKKGREKEVKRIENILNWYRTKESKYVRQTEEGPKVIIPPDMGYRVNKNLTVAYELIIKELESLDLL